MSEFPNWLRTFLLEFGRAVRNLLSRFSVLKIFAALDHDKDGGLSIEDIQQSIHQVRNQTPYLIVVPVISFRFS